MVMEYRKAYRDMTSTEVSIEVALSLHLGRWTVDNIKVIQGAVHKLCNPIFGLFTAVTCTADTATAQP